jgi:hypothetical protein
MKGKERRKENRKDGKKGKKEGKKEEVRGRRKKLGENIYTLMQPRKKKAEEQKQQQQQKKEAGNNKKPVHGTEPADKKAETAENIEKKEAQVKKHRKK